MNIKVLNPNSNQLVTDNMKDAIEEIPLPDGVDVLCDTLSEGPFGIETDTHIATVIEPVVSYVSNGDADAFVVACYSDPGVRECRARLSKRVLGIQESAINAAVSDRRRFGVIALSEASKARHLRYIEALDMTRYLAAERVANLSVHESAAGSGTFDILLETATQLRDLDKAEAIILGCAGMAKHRQGLETELGVSVIDPVQAAVLEAVGAVQAQP